MRRGYVVAVHPEDHSVDVLLSDGSRLVGVQVMTANASTRSGIFDMPAVPAKKDKWDVSLETGQDQIAIVDYVDGMPLVVGFLMPQISQMTFNDVQRRVTRHQSDVLTSIDKDGNIQIQHPSGFYVRIAESAALEDLTRKNTDKNLVLDRNKTKRIGFHVRTANGTAAFSMTADGDVTLTGRSVNISGQSGDVVIGGISLVHHTHGGVEPGGGSTSQPS